MIKYDIYGIDNRDCFWIREKDSPYWARGFSRHIYDENIEEFLEEVKFVDKELCGEEDCMFADYKFIKTLDSEEEIKQYDKIVVNKVLCEVMEIFFDADRNSFQIRTNYEANRHLMEEGSIDALKEWISDNNRYFLEKSINELEKEEFSEYNEGASCFLKRLFKKFIK